MILLYISGVLVVMRMQKILMSFSALVMLSACSGSVEGIGKDLSMVKESIPTGYAGHSKPKVFKPQSLQAMPVQPVPFNERVPVVSRTDNRVVDMKWNEIGSYNGTLPSGAAMPAPTRNDDAMVDLAPIGAPPQPAPQPVMQGAVEYNKDVSVFPLDGEAAYAPQYVSPTYSYQQNATETPYFDYGRLVQKFYFAHGSSAIAAKDKGQMKDLAKGVARMEAPVEVTVVGHASKRVEQTDDPIKKKMINFEMAQKRANAVTQELRKNGVTPDWVMTVSKGDDEPNLEPGLMAQEAADRRVELFMKTK